jgi:Uncharacterised nucleotidyltransferase
MPNADVTPEDAEFLLATTQPRPDLQRTHRLLQNISNLDPVIALARTHGVLPLLCSCLIDSSDTDTALSSEYASQLHDEYCINLTQNLAATSELLSLLAAFTQNGIPALPFKGVVLADSAYGKVGLRPAGDLDLLIYQRDVPRAAKLLIGSGYELSTPVEADGTPLEAGKYEYHFERPSDGMIVEVRWRLTQSDFRADLGMDWLWPRRQTAALLGTEVPAISPEHTLLLLCLHGSKHEWSRLIWVCDVAQLLVSHPALDWDTVLRDANRFGLSNTLALGLLLSIRLAGVSVPKRIELHLKRNHRICILAQHIKTNFWDDARRIPGEELPYHVQLLGFGDRARWWWRQRPLRPNQKDRNMVHIPKAFDFLYYLVRPVRLVRDYWRRDY